MARRVRWLHVLSANGLRRDGPPFVYEDVALRSGRYHREAFPTEVGEPGTRRDAPSPLERRFEADVDVAPGRILLLELSGQQALILRG